MPVLWHLCMGRTGVKDTLSEVAAQRTILAIPFYTRLWKTTDGGALTSEAIGMDQAQQTISDNGAETYWDKKTSQNYGTYEGDGATYQIWLEDSKSIAEKVKLIKNTNWQVWQSGSLDSRTAGSGA